MKIIYGSLNKSETPSDPDFQMSGKPVAEERAFFTQSWQDKQVKQTWDAIIQ